MPARRLPALITRHVARHLAVALLSVSVLAAQPGFVAGVAFAWSVDTETGCSGCPCEGAELAAATAEPHARGADHGSDECPDGGCPLGCDDCTCCPGGTPAAAPAPARGPVGDPGGERLASRIDPASSQPPDRLFKPPRAPRA